MSDLAILRTISELRAAIAVWRRAGQTVALVPTMGALHDAHIALMREARSRADRVVATIFVNPAQFAFDKDLETYPRREAADIQKLLAGGIDLLFAPDASEMYPNGFATTVTITGPGEGLCGDHRPGHFAGVATVVTKLLLQALPDIALFGEKDYQQLQVIRRLCRDLDIPVEILGVPTVREPDGLAMSSRNLHLSDVERDIAPQMHQILKDVVARVIEGEAPDTACANGRANLAKAGFSPVEYLELRDAETLAEPVTGEPQRVLAAAWLGETRLIDNISLA
jgi:pantoate--beta-alanine ligase